MAVAIATAARRPVPAATTAAGTDGSEAVVGEPQRPPGSAPADPTPLETDGPAGPPLARTVATTLLLDLGLPLAAYYVLRLLGVDDVVALLAGSAVAAVRVGYEALGRHRFDGFAAYLLAMFGVGLALTFVTGDARFLLLKGSIGAAVAGLVFLGTTVARRPLSFHAAKRMFAARPGATEQFDDLWRRSRDFRHVFDVVALVWGLGLVTEAVARVPLVLTLPVPIAVVVTGVLGKAAYVGMTVWTVTYTRRRQAEGRAAGLFRPVATTSTAPPEETS